MNPKKSSMYRDQDALLAEKTKYAQSPAFQIGGSDILSDALQKRMQAAYAGELSDIRNKMGRDNLLDISKLNETRDAAIMNEYRRQKMLEAQRIAAEQAAKARKRAKRAGLASLAGSVAGAYLIPGPAGAAIGGGVGGLLGGQYG